jgi:hypothetical protein
MWRRWVCVALLTAMTPASACSYATMPYVDAGPRGPGARGGRPCTTSRIAPRLDTIWVATGGLMVGEAGLFVAAEMLAPERRASPLSADDTYEIALITGGIGALLLRTAVKSRRHGYRMAQQCEDDRHAEPAYCVVDRTGEVWRTTIIARNDGPLSQTFAVVANIAEGSSPPRELAEVIALSAGERRQVAAFAQRELVTSCTVELRPVALLHDR